MNKKKVVLTISLILFLIFIVTLFINIYMINSTKSQIVSIDSLEGNYDAILVLGCKVNGNSPSLMLAKRLDKGMDVYHKTNTKILLSGDHGKNEYDEVDVMKEYLINSGISDEDIFLDHAGFNTYDSIYRAKYIFGVKKIIIITQEYHMYRALYLANCLGIEAVGVNASNIPQKDIMLKNKIREVFSRDKNFFKGIIKPQSKYLGEKISLS